jgi:hypothetical protein
MPLAANLKFCKYKGWNGRECAQVLGIYDDDYCPLHRDGKTAHGGISSPKSKRKSAYDHRWREQRLRVLKRDRYMCRIRGKGCTYTATTVDHVEALMNTGNVRVPDSELRAACAHCNSSRGASEGNRARAAA